MRVVVIGTSGQLATELHRAAHSDLLTVSPPEKIDITDADTLHRFLDARAPELILNASAYTAVDRAESDRERAFAVNELGPSHLADWCQAHGSSLFHVSTDYVFDGKKRGAYVESDATGPLSVYGASKRAGEARIRARLPQHLIWRTSWVFSAHGNNFVKTILRLSQERSELRVVADQTGCPTPARSLASAMLCLAERLAQQRNLAWGTFHFAGAATTTWHRLAEAVVSEQAETTGKRPVVTPISTAEFPTAAVRPMNSVLDCSAFEQTFDIRRPAWNEELRTTVQELLGAT